MSTYCIDSEISTYISSISVYINTISTYLQRYQRISSVYQYISTRYRRISTYSAPVLLSPLSDEGPTLLIGPSDALAAVPQAHRPVEHLLLPDRQPQIAVWKGPGPVRIRTAQGGDLPRLLRPDPLPLDGGPFFLVSRFRGGWHATLLCGAAGLTRWRCGGRRAGDVAAVLDDSSGGT